jgi:hypothetical protein
MAFDQATADAYAEIERLKDEVARLTAERDHALGLHHDPVVIVDGCGFCAEEVPS